jgi:soluble cytochrome b562
MADLNKFADAVIAWPSRYLGPRWSADMATTTLTLISATVAKKAVAKKLEAKRAIAQKAAPAGKRRRRKSIEQERGRDCSGDLKDVLHAADAASAVANHGEHALYQYRRPASKDRSTMTTIGGKAA